MDQYTAKILAPDEVSLWARTRGNAVVALACGCFDLLHAGHLALFQDALLVACNLVAYQGASGRAPLPVPHLIVALNDDEGVTRLKGPRRPIQPLQERLKIVAALRYPSAVTWFSGDTPLSVIRAVQPDLYAKGGDYRVEDLPEAPLVQELGGRVVIVERVLPQSTTALIGKMALVNK